MQPTDYMFMCFAGAFIVLIAWVWSQANQIKDLKERVNRLETRHFKAISHV